MVSNAPTRRRLPLHCVDHRPFRNGGVSRQRGSGRAPSHNCLRAEICVTTLPVDGLDTLHVHSSNAHPSAMSCLPSCPRRVLSLTPDHNRLQLFNTRTRGSNQQLAILWFPELFGWTPSPVSLASSKPVQQSTTVIGLSDVFLAAAHSGMALLSASTLWAHCAQFGGFMGIICATLMPQPHQ